MTPTEIVVFSCVIGAVLLVSVVSTLIVSRAIANLETRLDESVQAMYTRSQPKQLESANAAAQSAQAIVQTTVQEISKFKDQIHGEMQRFYAIMSRNEKAVKKQESTLQSPEAESGPPDTVDAASFNPEPPPGHEISRAELRLLAKKAGL